MSEGLSITLEASGVLATTFILSLVAIAGVYCHFKFFKNKK